MPIQIGKHYIENLSRIKNHILSLNNGGFQEDPQLLKIESRGTCYYDQCPIKNFPEDIRKAIPADISVKFEYDRGSKQHYFFHKACLEFMLHKDTRITLPN